MARGNLGLMCMIALDKPGPLDLFALRRAAQTVAPRAQLTIERRRAPPGDTALVATIDGQSFAIYATPDRIPEAEYQEGCSGNLFWPEAADAMARHRASVAICAVERERVHGLVRAQAVALTRLAAIVAEATPSSGLHWIGTKAMASPDRVMRAVGEIARGLWPVDLWLGYVVFGTEHPGGASEVGVQTLGAADYLGFEIEVPPYPTPERIQPIRILFGAVGYLMAYGDVIRDGQLVEIAGERRTQYRLHLGGGSGPGLARLEVVEG